MKNINTTKVNDEFIQAQAQEWADAAAIAQAAAEAYTQDIETRSANLEQQSAELKAQINELEDQRSDLADQMSDLASRGQLDEAGELDAQLIAIDRQLTSLRRKYRICNVANVKGSAELYEAAKAAYDALEGYRAAYRENIDNIKAAVRAEIDRLAAMERELGYAKDRDPSLAAGEAWKKADRHYRDLDRLEQEAKDKAAAERKAEEAKRGGTYYHW